MESIEQQRLRDLSYNQLVHMLGNPVFGPIENGKIVKELITRREELGVSSTYRNMGNGLEVVEATIYFEVKKG